MTFSKQRAQADIFEKYVSPSDLLICFWALSGAHAPILANHAHPIDQEYNHDVW